MAKDLVSVLLVLASKESLTSRSLTATIFSVMLVFSWEIHLPWTRNLMAVLPHTALWVLLVVMISWVAEDRGFELLYSSLQVLGKIMHIFFGSWASSFRGCSTEFSLSHMKSFQISVLGKKRFWLLVNIFLCCQKTWNLPKLFTQDCVSV